MPTPSDSKDPGSGQADASPRIGRPRDEGRHQAILDAALEVVAEVGYDRMSMDAVAARARASKATIYRRWPGKAELVLEAVGCGVDKDPSTAVPDQGSLRADLLSLVRLIQSGMEGTSGDLLFGLAMAARNDPELGRVLHDQIFNAKQSVAAILIERAKARGEVAADVDARVLDEVGPGVLMLRQLMGQPIDEEFIVHLTDNILLPLFTPATSTSSSPQEPQYEPRHRP